MWMSAAPGSISVTTPPSASTLWVHTCATAAKAGCPNLDSGISKWPPSVKVPVLPLSNTHPQQTQMLPHLMNCSPVPCRDLLPHLDCSPWNQESSEWPQRDRQQEISPQSPFISPKLPHSHETVWPPCLLPQALSHFFNRIQDLGRNFSSASVLNTVQVRAGPKGGRWKHPIKALGNFGLEGDIPTTKALSLRLCLSHREGGKSGHV